MAISFLGICAEIYKLSHLLWNGSASAVASRLYAPRPGLGRHGSADAATAAARQTRIKSFMMRKVLRGELVEGEA